MAHLYKHLRVHQVFGANTDVGKTLFTTALCRASTKSRKVYYLKPVSTGPAEEADASHVARFAGSARHNLKTDCLFQLDDPVSPHLAVKLASSPGDALPLAYSQSKFIERLESHIIQTARSVSSPSSMFIETAGGVHSPTLSGVTQADAYRPLFLPTILIGDSRLGGISATISAYESLMLRGYQIDAVLFLRETYYRNHEFISDYFRKLGKDIHVAAIQTPPSKHHDLATNTHLTEEYYREICGEINGTGDASLSSVLDTLDNRHIGRLDELASMPRRTLDTVWWPFVQHQSIGGESDVMVINSAHGDFYSAFTANSSSSLPAINSVLQPRFDGSASWWTQSVGHSHPELTQAAAEAAGRYGHVIFPMATHKPALTLAERLVKDGPGKGWASKAFFSDNGSTGVEVALKMAVRGTSLRYQRADNTDKKELGVIGLRGSYHGDTIGAMDACEGGVYNASVEWHRERGHWFDPPTVGIRDGRVIIATSVDEWLPSLQTFDQSSNLAWTDDGLRETFSGPCALADVYDVNIRLDTPLAAFYKQHVTRILEKLVLEDGRAFGALILEPILMGAAGMVFVDPLFHRILIDVVRARSDLWAHALGSTYASRGPIPKAVGDWEGLPVIFDEVFVGLYRLGMLTSTSIIGTNPDISILAKVLTGGLLPLSVTLTNQSVFDAFLGEKKVDAMLHGHSYTAHPIGCAVANKSLDLLESLKESPEWTKARESWGVTTPPVGVHISPPPSTPEIWSLWSPEFVMAVSRFPLVEEVMTLGTVLAIRLRDADAGYQASSSQAFLTSVQGHLDTSHGLHFRPLGNVAYLMTSLNTSSDIIRSLEHAIITTLEQP